MVFQDELLDWKPRNEIVSRGERGVFGCFEFDVRCEIVDVVVDHVGDGGFEPAVGDALVCVQKAKYLACCVVDTGVSGCVRRLNSVFGEVRYSVVFGGVVLDDLWGSVGGVVVDGENFGVGGMGEKRVESGCDSTGVVVDRNND